ncbi:hypothetical protein AQUSIP_07090 [Aquicella siphonis]|uniref:Uncharacterized protein n=1 Tax=Aquicella siphonis TaxID=254247 RepID=A0A5E4PEK8_9COXI|nr:DUF3421 domain-containing protein [Aquicella siphonis]VVC75419.1 hypothetical protein AQUSIP_07090 [Aquicella siphonis]
MTPIKLLVYLLLSIYPLFCQANQIIVSGTGDMHWLPVKNMEMPRIHYANGGLPDHPINICRAPLPASTAQATQQTVMYPGMLTPGGCEIAYDGTTKVISRFYLLSGQDNELRWIPIADVKKSIGTANNSSGNPATLVRDLPAFDVPVNYPPFVLGVSFSDTIRPYSGLLINGGAAIIGGYGNGNPVLICRVRQNGGYAIGRQVFFTASNNKDQDACHVGVNGKEVSVQNTYELLFCANPQSKCNNLTDELLNQATSGNKLLN